MRFLITAIGSMSAECAIKKIKAENHFVVGCDIYPGEWHYETKLCDKFEKAPFATNKNVYVQFLINVCKMYDLKYIIPLTDLEIDVINEYRHLFEIESIVLCMQTSLVLNIVRDKYKLSKTFEHDDNVPSIKTYLLSEMPDDMVFPCIAKPYNGRSSEGLLRNATREQVETLENKEFYILQEQLPGNVFTVDFCRNASTRKCCAIPRQELLRTKNGAGLTIQTSNDKKLIELVSYIGDKLNINGCVNMEFIYNENKYYLIDINPRFSAGIAFSVVSGYNMVLNHIRCFVGDEIEGQVNINEQIIIKKYEEVICKDLFPKSV